MRQMKMFGVASVLLFVGYAFVVDQVPARAQGEQRRQAIARGNAPQMPANVRATKSASGTMILTDAKGMTLYTFAKDTAGVSNCNGNCAKNWPPLSAAADATAMGDWTVVTREDGIKMWAYKGMPLYGWIKDAKPGDTTGDGVGNGAWKIALQ